jgi:hypothetical protein
VALFFFYLFHRSLKFYLFHRWTVTFSLLAKYRSLIIVLFCFSLLIVFYRTSIPRRGLTVVKQEETCTIWIADFSSLLKKHQQMLWVKLCWHQNRWRFGFGIDDWITLHLAYLKDLCNGYHLSNLCVRLM